MPVFGPDPEVREVHHTIGILRLRATTFEVTRASVANGVPITFMDNYPGVHQEMIQKGNIVTVPAMYSSSVICRSQSSQLELGDIAVPPGLSGLFSSFVTLKLSGT